MLVLDFFNVGKELNWHVIHYLRPGGARNPVLLPSPWHPKTPGATPSPAPRPERLQPAVVFLFLPAHPNVAWLLSPLAFSEVKRWGTEGPGGLWTPCVFSRASQSSE